MELCAILCFAQATRNPAWRLWHECKGPRTGTLYGRIDQSHTAYLEVRILRQLVTIAACSALRLASVPHQPAQESPPPTIDLPRPSGALPVSRTAFHWTDSTRLLEAGRSTPRELMVHLWYPAQASSRAVPGPYVPGAALLRGQLDRAQFEVLQSARIQAGIDQPVASSPSRFPVVILSHGNQTGSFLYASIIEELVSHGYVVAALDHPGEALFTIFPGERVVPYSEEGRPLPGAARYQDDITRYLRGLVERRAADIAFTMTQLEKLNALPGQRFFRRLDMSRTGVMGHSNGGIAAGLACDSNRVKACLNLDGRAESGPYLRGREDDSPSAPFLYFAKPLRIPTDDELAKQSLTRAEFDRVRAQTVQRDDELMELAPAGSYRVLLKDASHETFSDEPFLIPATDSSARALNRRRLDMVRAVILSFLETHVANRPTVRVPDLPKRFPDLVVTAFSRR
jgi:predicted dienelactone hydrolase